MSATRFSVISRRLPLVFALLFTKYIHADVGIFVYQSKGVDARRTSTGHLALVATTLCPDGIEGVRTCRAGEQPGVVITRYDGMAYGHPDWHVFTLPMADYLNISGSAEDAPVLSSGGTLETLQMNYWRTHMRNALPPLTQQQYQALRAELDRFDMRRTLTQAFTMELFVKMLLPKKKKYPTEPIALIDPLNGELIPNGRWREAVGATHTRSSLLITAPATAAQEQRLVPFIASTRHLSFQAMADNCSDFSKLALLTVFSDSGLQFHRRMDNVADAFISTPLDTTTEFVRFADRSKTPITVKPLPMLAGTRFPTADITSVTRGALLPNAQQGKVAFAIKSYVGWLNPYIPLTAYSLDRLSHFVNLPQMIHERGGGQLSEMTASIKAEKQARPDELNMLRREQFRVFGTTSCWKQKQDEFMALMLQSRELGILTGDEQHLLLKPGRPYLLPRLYEKRALNLGRPDNLLAGLPAYTNSANPRELVPGRSKILEMVSSEDEAQQVQAFELMTAVINFDLASEPERRRSAQDFDSDWNLFLDVAAKDALHIPDDAVYRESVAACSCRQFDMASVSRDAFDDSQRLGHQVVKNIRTLVLGPVR